MQSFWRFGLSLQPWAGRCMSRRTPDTLFSCPLSIPQGVVRWLSQAKSRSLWTAYGGALLQPGAQTLKALVLPGRCHSSSTSAPPSCADRSHWNAQADSRSRPTTAFRDGWPCACSRLFADGDQARLNVGRCGHLSFEDGRVERPLRLSHRPLNTRQHGLRLPV